MNRTHRHGARKADWFDRALGFTEENSELLAAQIVRSRQHAVATALTQFGRRYEQMIPITGTNGRRIPEEFVCSENPDHGVRLVTAEPTKRKGE